MHTVESLTFVDPKFKTVILDRDDMTPTAEVATFGQLAQDNSFKLDILASGEN
jgi:hypothetical protein